MKPLYWIAMGVAVVVFTVTPDDRWGVSTIVGTALVLLGWFLLARARPDLPFRLTLTYLAVLALVVAAALAAPEARSWLDDADPAVQWAADLPALGFQAVLAHSLAGQARAARARAGWLWTVAAVAIVAALVANVLVNGVGWDWLDGIGTVGLVGVFLVIVMCVVHGPAPWAGAPEPEADSEQEAPAG